MAHRFTPGHLPENTKHCCRARGGSSSATVSVDVRAVGDDPEDDGQPSEYEEWQDYFGGDEYYDHSENGGW